MKNLSKRTKTIISVVVGVVIVIGIIGGGMKLHQEHEKQYFISVAKSEEAHKLIEDYLKEMDKDALTDKGKIKSYTVDYDTVHKHPMGGFTVKVYINDDKDMDITFDFDKPNIVGEDPKLTIVGSVISVELDEMVGDNND